jgi:hypothetical protein
VRECERVRRERERERELGESERKSERREKRSQESPCALAPGSRHSETARAHNRPLPPSHPHITAKQAGSQPSSQPRPASPHVRGRAASARSRRRRGSQGRKGRPRHVGKVDTRGRGQPGADGGLPQRHASHGGASTSWARGPGGCPCQHAVRWWWGDLGLSVFNTSGRDRGRRRGWG